MNAPKTRIQYACLKALTEGLWFALIMSLVDLFMRPREFIAVTVIINICFGIAGFFLFGYLGYNRYLKQFRHFEESRETNRRLENAEFRCFKCENIINRSENKCSQCGWTWK